VRKAERYKALRAELRELDLRIGTRKRRAMSGECDASRKELLSLEDALIAVRSEISRLESGRERALAAREEREKILAGMREEHARGKEEAARREAEWEGLRAQAEQLRRMIAEIDGEPGLG
jgi:chromosome segregation ATPase